VFSVIYKGFEDFKKVVEKGSPTRGESAN